MGKSAVIARGMFAGEWRNGRISMGYILGLAFAGYWMRNFLQYAADIGEPVNILETFCVVEQHYVTILFLTIGWFLVIADAPFIKKNTYLCLHRCGRKHWNAGMLLYIAGQALLYVALLALFTIVVSSFSGFAADIWSSPAFSLARDVGNDIGVKYNISFPWLEMMKCMTVPQAFGLTVLYLYLYFAVTGVLLYVVALLFSGRTGIAGIVTVMSVHLTGYLLMMDGHVEISLLARAIPGYFVDGTKTYWQSAVIFVLVLVVLCILSAILVKKVEFPLQTEVEG